MLRRDAQPNGRQPCVFAVECGEEAGKRVCDFAFQPSIDRTLIEEHATGRFTSEGRNVIFQGPPGVGKTHLAIALGLACSEAGLRLHFLTALDFVRRMKLAAYTPCSAATSRWSAGC